MSGTFLLLFWSLIYSQIRKFVLKEHLPSTTRMKPPEGDISTYTRRWHELYNSFPCSVLSRQCLQFLTENVMEDHLVILITGGSGFLGQHLYRVLQERGEKLKEIRMLDIVPFDKKFGTEEKIPTKCIIGDVTRLDERCKEAFHGIDAVFHCAAYVSYEFPPDTDNLQRVNVQGTKNVVELCIDSGVRYLVYTSTAEASVVPYFRNGFFSVIVNATESKFRPPEDSSQFVFGEYAKSKLEGERIVLEANMMAHRKGGGRLRTLSLRPAILYGEHDTGLLPILMALGFRMGETFWRVGGPGGKHQFCYAGNAAWAHLCALRTLQENPDAVNGLPVNITDDTFVYDQLRFCEKMLTLPGRKPLVSCSWWYIPALICFLLATIYETVYKFINKFVPLPKNPISPKTLTIYLGSVIFFYRLRAIIHINYSPIYGALDVLGGCRDYYLKQAMCMRQKSDRKEPLPSGKEIL